MDPQYAYVITSILSDKEARRPAFGAAAETLSLPDRPSAAKTGTTNDYRDAWTLGYTPDLAVGVWVGNADYKPMKKTAGSVGAAPIWQNVMRRSLQGTPATRVHGATGHSARGGLCGHRHIAQRGLPEPAEGGLCRRA